MIRRTFLLIIFYWSFLIAQKNSEGIYNAFPIESGFIFTNKHLSTISICKDGNTIVLITSTGVGNYFSVSSDKQSIGIKIIYENGMQQPAIFNLNSKEVNFLSPKVKSCGQVSFSDSGEVVFSLMNKIILQKNGKQTEFEIPNYSNLTPISPNGKLIAFNDNDDQIFVLNINNGNIKRITDSEKGFFLPLWSSDSKKLMFSSLDAHVFVYDFAIENISEIGYGLNPKWSKDGSKIIFYRNEIVDDELKNSDIYTYNFETSITEKITDTPNKLEIDPSFVDDSRILYSNSNENFIHEKNISFGETITYSVEPNVSAPANINSELEITSLDIPYLNQVYDTPDWFNGHWACGPTSAMMVIAYYKLLPKWEVFCSWPNGHYTSYGNYIADKYYFKQIDYSSSAGDPNGNPGFGGYGYMWTGSNSPHSRIANYYKNHGLTATTYDAPPFSQAKSEISNNYPYTMCVGLTSAGHIVIAHGFGNEEHTFVFNDAYGNKNNGYMNYYGKNVKYDWPGYNNGYQNLNQVYWCTTAHGDLPAPADTIVDDLQFDNGFYIHTKKPSTMKLWKDKNYGYKNHFWFTYSKSGNGEDTCYALWTPNLSKEGRYEVRAYIPYSNSTAAYYKIFHKDGCDTIWVNQKIVKDAWVSLGIYPFEKGSAGFVRLGDFTGIKGEEIVFDAVEWIYQNPTNVDNQIVIPNQPVLFDNYPNPFNPNTEIKFFIPETMKAKLIIYDNLGRVVDELLDNILSAGEHKISFNASNYSSGVYYYRLITDNFTVTKKMLLIK